MTYVVGFEGTSPTQAMPVSWGAAALSVDDRLYNPTTGRTSTLARLDELVAAGHLTQLPRAARLPEGAEASPVVVVAIRRSYQHFRLIQADPGRCPGFIRSARGVGIEYYFFKSIEYFDQYSNNAANKIVGAILTSIDADSLDRGDLLAHPFEDLVSVGLTLKPSHPQLNGLRTVLSGHDEFVEQLARASLRGGRDEVEFDAFVSACGRFEHDYKIVMKEGVAEGGGVDVDIAAKWFTSFKTIHGKVSSQLRNQYGFLDRVIPAPRFARMEAASADIFLAPNVSNRSLAERVARVYELRLIERVLSGEEREYLADQKMAAAINSIVQPGPNTVVQHQRLGIEDLEVLAPELVLNQEEGPIEPFSVLGFQSGLINNAQQIEVMIFPKIWFHVSAIDDGEGGEPVGAQVLQNEGRALFQPAVFQLNRSFTRGGSPVYRLLQVTPLDVGAEALVTALPSSVVSEAFLLNPPMLVRRPEEEYLEIGPWQVEGVGGKTRPAAALWLESYASRCREVEFNDGWREEARWLVPALAPRPTPLIRVLTVLYELDEAPIAAVVEQILRRFQVEMRVNNTRREVLRNPTLLLFTGADGRSMKISEEGRRYFDVYRRVADAP